MARPDFKNDVYASGKGNSPFYYDRDYYCSMCGEPWGAYHIRNELSKPQRTKFFDGLGCQACEFGVKPHYQLKAV